MAAKWQGMETAPRDRDFLVQLTSGYSTRARFIGLDVIPDAWGYPAPAVKPRPVAWQELPEPFKAKAPKGKRATNDYTDDFLNFYFGFPTRRGESKFDAFKAWRALGPTLQQQAVAAKPIYVQECARKDPDYFPATAVWLRQRRFETLLAQSAPPSSAQQPGETRADWERRVGLWRKTSNWNPSFGPAPGNPGCRVPADVLGQFGL